MKNKTCGECKHFEVDIVAAKCEKKLWICDDDTPACKKFEQKPLTNGDVIRQGGNQALAEFKSELPCAICAYANTGCFAPAGRQSDCKSGILAWLDAPAKERDDDTDR